MTDITITRLLFMFLFQNSEYDRYFNDISHVQELYLAENDIKSIHGSMFQSVQRLEVLDLSYNKIAIIHKHTFIQLKLLCDLRLRNNDIMEIDVSEILSGIIWKWIDLTGNKIRRFQDLEGLQIIPYASSFAGMSYSCYSSN